MSLTSLTVVAFDSAPSLFLLFILCFSIIIVTPMNQPDLIRVARCDIRCQSQISNKAQCMKNCLKDWKKPGKCIEEWSIVNNNNNTNACSVQQCSSDNECYGISICCSTALCGNSCKIPMDLDEIRGLPSKPTNISFYIENTQHNELAKKITIQWIFTDFEREPVKFLIEERRCRSGYFHTARNKGQWKVVELTSNTSKSVTHSIRRDVWIQFRVTSVNAIGSKGPSNESKPLFIPGPSAPEVPGEFKIGARSWGNEKLHLQLIWTVPKSVLPICCYKITWSSQIELKLREYSHSIPSKPTSYWLRGLHPETKYFLQVRALSICGKRKLQGMPASIVFTTPRLEKGKMLISNMTGRKVKYKRHIRRLKMSKMYWVRNELIGCIVWKPIHHNAIINYSITWSHHRCNNTSQPWYIATTQMNNFELYDLQPECEYRASVKAILNDCLYTSILHFNTSNNINIKNNNNNNFKIPSSHILINDSLTTSFPTLKQSSSLLNDY